jgi:GrpB-like predicted nucleotidyltransferase (UPF0157 family)
MGTDPAPEYLLPREVAHTVVLSEPDPCWPDTYASEAARIRLAVPDALVEMHHVGSTSVPGLSAKPIIDIVLSVADSTDEDSYVPALQAAGYQLHVREPAWHEHRLLRRGTPHFSSQPCDGHVPKVNLHVFTAGSSEARRMLVFRDWLRTHPEDRVLYEETKRELAERRWPSAQDYAEAKSTVVGEIMGRALHD